MHIDVYPCPECAGSLWKYTRVALYLLNIGRERLQRSAGCFAKGDVDSLAQAAERLRIATG